MLGKRPRPNFLRTTSKPQLNGFVNTTVEEEGAGNGVSVTTEQPNKSSPAASHVVVVGFKLAGDVANESLGSPRSVLEPTALCCTPNSGSGSVSTSKAAPRSPRSILGSLLSAQGVGLGVVVASSSDAAAPKSTESELQRALEASKVSQLAPIAAAKVSVAESNAGGHAHFDVNGTMDHIHFVGTQNGMRDVHHGYIGTQHVMDHVLFTDQTELQSHNVGANHLFEDNNNGDREYDDDEAVVDDGTQCRAMDHVHYDDCNECGSHDVADGDVSDDDNDNEDSDDDIVVDNGDDQLQNHGVDHDMGIKQSIFSTASPASSSCSFGFQCRDFLSVCFLCKRHLGLGNDIYMYRGDQAFCSAECRYQQITLDDYKERRSATPNCYTGSSTHQHRMLAVTSAAVA